MKVTSGIIAKPHARKAKLHASEMFQKRLENTHSSINTSNKIHKFHKFPEVLEHFQKYETLAAVILGHILGLPPVGTWNLRSRQLHFPKPGVFGESSHSKRFSYGIYPLVMSNIAILLPWPSRNFSWFSQSKNGWIFQFVMWKVYQRLWGFPYQCPIFLCRSFLP